VEAIVSTKIAEAGHHGRQSVALVKPFRIRWRRRISLPVLMALPKFEPIGPPFHHPSQGP
jgi:hypothetical protein